MPRLKPLVALCLALAVVSLSAPAAAAASGCEARASSLERLEHLRDVLPRYGPFARFILGSLVRRAIRNVATRYADDCVALNQVQVIGTHNSYHIQPVPSLIEFYLNFDPAAFELEYSHRPLAEQLDMGIRQFELDVFYDPDGGLYSEPLGLEIRDGEGARLPPELDAPGIKTLHIQDIDWDTTCFTLIECMEEIEAWSVAHPGHTPIFVMVEPKDDFDPDLVILGLTIPLPWDTAALETIDEEVRTVFSPDRLITPDDVRNGAATLDAAVLDTGWPSLGESRGKILFGLCNKRDAYRAGHPVLEDRVMFTAASPGDPDAAFVKINGAKGNEALIQDVVAAGYIVRTRADSATAEARANDTSTREAALESGGHYVSTDYPEPDPFDGEYVVTLPGGRAARCNPVNGPRGCRDGALDRAHWRQP